MAYSKKSNYSRKTVKVDGYTKKDGTRVAGYTRSKPTR